MTDYRYLSKRRASKEPARIEDMLKAIGIALVFSIILFVCGQIGQADQRAALASVGDSQVVAEVVR